MKDKTSNLLMLTALMFLLSLISIYIIASDSTNLLHMTNTSPIRAAATIAVSLVFDCIGILFGIAAIKSHFHQ